MVEQAVLGDCSRPRTAHQPLTNGVNGFLSCPLRDCMDKLDSYNVPYSLQWYKVSGRWSKAARVVLQAEVSTCRRTILVFAAGIDLKRSADQPVEMKVVKCFW